MVTLEDEKFHETATNGLTSSREVCDHVHNTQHVTAGELGARDPGERRFGSKASEMVRDSSMCKRLTPPSGRLFVSAILSLISILISPVLSTDAMWNVITDATGTGL